MKGLALNAYKTEAVANEDCHEGWYWAIGYHTAVLAGGVVGTAQTANYNYIYCP